MSDTKTNWILELTEKVLGPMKNIMKSADSTVSAYDRVVSSMDRMDDASRKAAETAIKDHRNLTGEINKQTQKVQELKKWLEQLPKDPLHRGPVEFDISQAQTKIRRYQEQLGEINRELEEISRKPDPAKVKRSWGEVAMYANQAWEVTQKIFDSTKFAADIKDLQTNVQRATNLTGQALDTTTAKVHNISKVYKEDGMEILRSANSVSKQMGITFDQALGLIEQGFQKGANLNGDMLSQLQEYGPQLRAAGISAAEGLAILAAAGKEGVYSDKALDAINEANLSLRELGQPQIDALKGIGIEVKTLAGKTSFEAMQMIARAMDGATVQAKENVIKNIFKEAGEVAGINFIEGLDSINLDPNSIPSVQEAGAGIKGWLASVESSFATTFGNIAVFGQQFGGVAQWISAGIPVIQALTKVTWLQNIATKALAVVQMFMNKAFLSSPIGWIVAGLTAVTIGVKYAWDNFEGFRAVIYGLWETFKQVFTNIKGLFTAVFAPIGEAIGAIKEGRWGDAAKAVLKLNPVSTAQRTIQYIRDGGMTKGIAEAYAKGDAMGRKSFQDDKKSEQSTDIETMPGATDRPVLDGKVAPSKKKGKGKKKHLGLDISGEGFGHSGSSGGGFESISGAGSGGGGKTFNVNNYITNNFGSINGDSDIRAIAAKVVQFINSGMKDAELSTS